VIAIVDDDESVRNAVVRLLQAAGHSARGYPSGQEFLDNWRVDRPDCLVLDLQMPSLSGADVQRALNREGAQFPVVIMSAHDSPSAREECLREGAVAYLRKPPDERMLLDALNLAFAGFVALKAADL
jgi:FixJ family two-component response regulator